MKRLTIAAGVVHVLAVAWLLVVIASAGSWRAIIAAALLVAASVAWLVACRALADLEDTATYREHADVLDLRRPAA